MTISPPESTEVSRFALVTVTVRGPRVALAGTTISTNIAPPPNAAEETVISPPLTVTVEPFARLSPVPIRPISVVTPPRHFLSFRCNVDSLGPVAQPDIGNVERVNGNGHVDVRAHGGLSCSDRQRGLNETR